MEKEISSGTMLGIVLIALAAIIGIGFGIFSIAKGTANEGVVNVQDNLAQVNASSFTDYDQKVVTGTQVVSAYNNFAGKSYAILIATQAYIDNSSEATIPGLSAAPKVDAYSGDPGTTATVMNATTSNGTTVPLKFLNYNAVLSNGGSGNAKIYFKDGVYKAISGFNLDTSGKIIFNTVISNLSKSGTVEYVPSSGRFQANLIKDMSGTIMGIAFQQLTVK
jgi:hypothetical protein